MQKEGGQARHWEQVNQLLLISLFKLRLGGALSRSIYVTSIGDAHGEDTLYYTLSLHFMLLLI